MSRAKIEIRMAQGGDREQATFVVRGTELDGLAFTGKVGGRLHICPPSVPSDIYGPSGGWETDFQTGRVLSVYRCVGRGDWPW